VPESSRGRFGPLEPFFISLFSAKVVGPQPPRKMAFVVGLHFNVFFLRPLLEHVTDKFRAIITTDIPGPTPHSPD
ncbi:MAG: hypothetical protein Q7T20_14540, partial [Saprospiraceae bacterium]|nr:hypothetical protein [Saprospiraceae bacterium]